MWRKIKGPVITICIMHLTALLCLIILSIVQCFVDMAEWIKFALSMAVNSGGACVRIFAQMLLSPQTFYQGDGRSILDNVCDSNSGHRYR